MKPAAWRLAVAAALFVAWLAYLAFLAAGVTLHEVFILSRPQLQLSGLDVTARRTGPDTFVVADVLYPHDAARQAEWKGKTITVANIDKCQLYSAKYGGQPVPPDTGQTYLLPLESIPGDEARFQVAPIPPSPGYSGEARGLGPAAGPPRVYPADDEVLRQYRTIPKP